MCRANDKQIEMAKDEQGCWTTKLTLKDVTDFMEHMAASDERRSKEKRPLMILSGAEVLSMNSKTFKDFYGASWIEVRCSTEQMELIKEKAKRYGLEI